jgi:hypothetical protein
MVRNARINPNVSDHIYAKSASSRLLNHRQNIPTNFLKPVSRLS